MKKIFFLIILFLITGCSAVRINTKNIDNIIDVILSKNNTLYNQIGKGYKYYVPRGVSYIQSNDLNDELYCNGNSYYLYIDAVSYYHRINNVKLNYNNKNVYYYKKISKDDFKYNGYLLIEKINDFYKIEFLYNYARFEAVVDKQDLNQTVLNASYILSTIKFNKQIIELALDEEYLNNKAEKYKGFSNNGKTEKFKLEMEKKDR